MTLDLVNILCDYIKNTKYLTLKSIVGNQITVGHVALIEASQRTQTASL